MYRHLPPSSCYCGCTGTGAAAFFSCKRGAAHLTLLMVIVVIITLFLYVGKEKKKFGDRLPAAASERKGGEAKKFWRLGDDGKKVSSSGVEFSSEQPLSAEERAKKYYPDYTKGAR